MNVSGCKVENRITYSKTHLDIDNSENILFLNFKIEKDSLEEMKISLLKKSWVSGTFKEIEHQPNFENGLLELEFLDKNHNLIKLILVKNPLISSYETYSPEGTIERKKTSLKETEFTVRTNMMRNVKFVRVKDIDGLIDIIEL